MKYKAEKRDWNVREKALQATIDRLRNENLDYRSANKAADFERQIKVRTLGCAGLLLCMILLDPITASQTL